MAKSQGKSEDKKKSVSELSAVLGGEREANYNEDFLQQFLIARNNDVTSAAAMFRKQLEWREKMGADDILADYEPPDVLKKYFMGGIVGEDRDGSVLIVQTLGRMDFQGIMKSASKFDILRYHVFRLETIYETFKANPKNFGKMSQVVTSIIDMEGCNLRHFWLPGVHLFSEMMRSVEENYPGMANRAFFINSPKFFPMIYRILSRFMSEATKTRIRVLGDDYHEELLKYIDSSQLPVHYGGTKSIEDDHFCSQEICYCGVVPTDYYIALDASNAKELVIRRGTQSRLIFDVSCPVSRLSWKISTNGHEVDFAVLQEESGETTIGEQSNATCLYSRRLCSHYIPECDSVVCSVAGTYVLTFDIFSRSRKRKIHYLVKINDVAAENEPIK